MSAVKSTLIQIQQEAHECAHREERMEQPHLKTKTLEPYTATAGHILRGAVSRLCPDEFAFADQDQLLAAAINEQRKITPGYAPKRRDTKRDTLPVSIPRISRIDWDQLNRRIADDNPELFKKIQLAETRDARRSLNKRLMDIETRRAHRRETPDGASQNYFERKQQ